MESMIKILNAFALFGCLVSQERRDSSEPSVPLVLASVWLPVLSALALGWKPKVRRMLSITDVMKP